MSDPKVMERIKNARHQSKPDKASVVIYDDNGNWVSEMYLPINWSVKVGSYRVFLEDQHYFIQERMDDE